MTAEDFAALPAEFGSEPFTTLDVVALIAPPSDPDAAVSRKHPEVRRALQRLGNALARRVDEPFALDGRQLVLRKAGTRYGSQQLWQFEPVAPAVDAEAFI